MNEMAESAAYEERLAEMFESCDSDDKGFLSLTEFEGLCQQLHLQPHMHRLYADLGINHSAASVKVSIIISSKSPLQGSSNVFKRQGLLSMHARRIPSSFSLISKKLFSFSL